MKRDPILEQLIPVRLWELLRLMHSRGRRWRPDLGYPDHSAGLASGGSVSIDSFEDLEAEADGYAVAVCEVAFDGLACDERLGIEIAMAWQPRVWHGRAPLETLIERAVMRMLTKMRKEGVAV